MIAHAVFDIPMTLAWQGVLVAALVIGAISIARRGLTIGRQVFSGGSPAAYGTLALLGTGFAIAAARVRSLEYVAVGLVGLAVAIEMRDRRRNRTTTEVAASS